MLDRAIQEVLEKGRVGTPVFVRWVAYVSPGCLKESLASMLVVTQSWLGTTPQRLYVQGGGDGALINASVLYASGQTALVTAAAVPGSQSSDSDLDALARSSCWHGLAPQRERTVRHHLTSAWENLPYRNLASLMRLATDEVAPSRVLRCQHHLRRVCQFHPCPGLVAPYQVPRTT